MKPFNCDVFFFINQRWFLSFLLRPQLRTFLESEFVDLVPVSGAAGEPLTFLQCFPSATSVMDITV